MIGPAAEFTVADYTLAPLSARLSRYQFDRAQGRLKVELAVESYQQPFKEPIELALFAGKDGIATGSASLLSPGVYRATLSPRAYDAPLAVRGEARAAWQLHLSVARKPSLVARVNIPGSRADERESTVIGSLGREVRFSLLPAPGSIPLRGGHLACGDAGDAPLDIDAVDAWPPRLSALTALEQLVVTVIDLSSGATASTRHGDLRAGDAITLDVPAPMLTVVVACYVDGRPFEAYASLFRPSGLQLAIEAPATARPGEAPRLRVNCPSHPGQTVLLSVRDQRLIAEPPDVALGAALKRNLDAAGGVSRRPGRGRPAHRQRRRSRAGLADP